MMRLPRRTIAVVVAVCAAAAAVFLRLHATPVPAFVGACERLRASGLPVTARDWFCLPTPLSARASYALALLLVAVGLVLPCAILAATGRRWSSLLPLAVAPWLTLPSLYSGTRWWNAGAAERSGIVTAGINTFVLAAPVICIWLVKKPRDRFAQRPGLAAALVAGTVCAAAFGFAGFLATRLLSDHWASLGGGVESTPLGPAMFSMGFFGLMLGTDRRWWPWSLAPVALLLSAAPSAAVIRNPQGLTDWSQWVVVVPIAFAGLAWSTWRPMSTWLSSRLDRSREAGAMPPAVSRSHRTALVLNASAVALLALSVIVFRADPLSAQIGMSLPTYLGERVQAQDVRTKLDLRQAIAALDVFASNGMSRGFDARSARRVDPSLAWSDGHFASDGSTTVPALTMSIEGTTRRTARIAASSESGRVFCIERTAGGSILYGSAEGNRYGEIAPSAFTRAIAHCGSAPWSGAAVRMLDTATMCEGADPSSSYLMCRMVQVLITDTMRQTKLV